MSASFELDPQTLVRDVLLDVPGAVEAFETHRIDYCCGGALSLLEASERAHVAIDVLLATLANEAQKPGAKTTGDHEMLSVPLADLVQTIVDKHHEHSRRDAPLLVAHARALAEAEGHSHPTLYAIAKELELLFSELLPHLSFEERHVFPYIVSLERAGKEGATLPAALFASIAEPIHEMILEHERADHALHAIRDLTHDYTAPASATDDMRALYRALFENEKELTRHMHLEGNVLFPRAERLETKLRASRGPSTRRRA
jgi:regulator of cell morphogenesis and NO signaling